MKSRAHETTLLRLASHGVAAIGDANSISQLSAKRSIVEQARQWPTYFCRFFPVSVRSVSFRCHQLTCSSPSAQIPKHHAGDVQMLGVSHSGVRLIRRNRPKAANDSLQVIETFPFDIIQQTSPIRGGSTMDLRLTKNRITVHSHRVRARSPTSSPSNGIHASFQIKRIKQFLDQYLKEARTEISKQPRSSYHAQRSHHGKSSPNLLSNTSDLLKSSSQASLISCSQTFSELIPSASFDNHTPKPTRTDVVSPSISALPTGHSMMEFALQNFQVPSRR